MEIKIRYTFKNNITDQIIQKVLDVSQIETNSFAHAEWKNSSVWEVIGRDLWTGWVDGEGNELYSGDRFFCERIYGKMPSRGYISKKHPKFVSGFVVIKFEDGKFDFHLESISPEHQEIYNKHQYQYGYVYYHADNFFKDGLQDHVKKTGDIYHTPELLTSK